MNLGDRMKEYERNSRLTLVKKVPVIIRVDGKAFHTLTKNFQRPFDALFMRSMLECTKKVMNEIQGCKLAYVQSDEVTFLLSDLDSIETQGWFNYNVNKLVSISASLMSVQFNKWFSEQTALTIPPAVFDSRAFNVPVNDVANCFLWRAKDWNRNSMQMYARKFFSHKELHGKNVTDMHNMLHSIGKNWTTDLSNMEKNGSFLLNGEHGILCADSILPNYKSISEIVNNVLYNEVDF